MKGKSLLFGLLSGTVLGVLFAPKSGKELRAKLTKERDAGGTGFDTITDSVVGMGKEMWSGIEHYYKQVAGEDKKKK